MASSDFDFSKFAELEAYQQVNRDLVEMVDLQDVRRVVDLACGTGLITGMLARRVNPDGRAVVIGVDRSPTALAEARESVDDPAGVVQFVEAEIENLRHNLEGPAEVIVLGNGIHYIEDKQGLLAEVSANLAPGGQFAFNTSFFEGSHPEETQTFYKRWMMRSLRRLKKEHGVSPDRSEKVESRKKLSPEDYETLLEENGLLVDQLTIEVVDMPLEGWKAASEFEDFIRGILPGVPLKKASQVLKESVQDAYDDLGIETVPRNWLQVISRKPAPA